MASLAESLPLGVGGRLVVLGGSRRRAIGLKQARRIKAELRSGVCRDGI